MNENNYMDSMQWLYDLTDGELVDLCQETAGTRHLFDESAEKYDYAKAELESRGRDVYGADLDWALN